MRGSFNPGILGVVPPTVQARSFNFRQASTGTNFSGDVAPEIGVFGDLWADHLGDYGWVNPGTTGANSNRVTDRRVYGHWTQNAGNRIFRAVAPNGNYGLQFAMGACTVSNTRTGALIADTIDDGLVSGGLTGILATSGSAVAGRYYVTNDQQRIYKCAAPGTYTTGNPSGTGTGISDGGNATFDFVGPVLYIYDTGASPTLAANEVIDVDKAKRTEAAWAIGGGSTPVRLPVTLTRGGISLLPHPTAFGFPRHIGLFPQ